MSEASWLIVGLINLHIDNGGLAVAVVEKQYNTIIIMERIIWTVFDFFWGRFGRKVIIKK